MFQNLNPMNQQNAVHQLRAIISRVKTAMAYRDQYNRPVTSHIGAADVVPLARAAHAMGIQLPHDLLEDPYAGRPKLFRVSAVGKLLHSLEIALYKFYGLPPVQAAQHQGGTAAFQNNNPGPVQFNNNQQQQWPQQQPQVQWPQPVAPPQPQWPSQADFNGFQQQMPQVQPVAPQYDGFSDPAGQGMGQWPVQQQPQFNDPYAQPQRQQSQPPSQFDQLGIAPPTPPQQRTLSPAEQLGLVPPQGVPPLANATPEQLKAEAVEGIHVAPPRTPDGGKAEPPAMPGDGFDPLAFMEGQSEGVMPHMPNPETGQFVIDTPDPNAAPLIPPQGSPGRYALMTERQIDAELMRRSIAVDPHASKSTKIGQINSWDMTMAQKLANGG